MKVAKVLMSFQNLDDEILGDLINLKLETAEAIVKHLWESAENSSKQERKGLYFWDLITYVELLLEKSYRGKTCKNLINAGFLTFLRDILQWKYGLKNKSEIEEGTEPEEYELDDEDITCIVSCVRKISYFKAGCYGILSKTDLYPCEYDVTTFDFNLHLI